MSTIAPRGRRRCDDRRQRPCARARRRPARSHPRRCFPAPCRVARRRCDPSTTACRWSRARCRSRGRPPRCSARRRRSSLRPHHRASRTHPSPSMPRPHRCATHTRRPTRRHRDATLHACPRVAQAGLDGPVDDSPPIRRAVLREAFRVRLGAPVLHARVAQPAASPLAVALPRRTELVLERAVSNRLAPTVTNPRFSAREGCLSHPHPLVSPPSRRCSTCWCCPRSSKPVWGARSFLGRFDSCAPPPDLGFQPALGHGFRSRRRRGAAMVPWFSRVEQRDGRLARARGQVGVPHGHLDRSVPEQLPDLHEVRAAHHQV